MSKRSYKQNCALANALDLIGERWTLLIVRELMIGPRRYGELVENLLGIGTNLLAARLQELEARGLLEKEERRYRLTDLGRQLEPVVWELVRFGLGLQLADRREFLTRPEWDVVALRALLSDDRVESVDGRYRIELNGHSFVAVVDNDEIEVIADDGKPTLGAIGLSKPTARKLATGQLGFKEAIDTKKLAIEGSQREAQRWMRAFRLLPARSCS